MSRRVVITAIARNEALEAFNWYAEQSVTAAERWYSGLGQALNCLAEAPERHPVSEEDSAALGYEVRTLLYGRRRGVFRILYTISEDTIRVVRIRHAARGPIEP